MSRPVSDRPILFSAPMVRALLAGTKTQTRRIIKPQPTFIQLSGRWGWHIPPAKRHGCDFVVTASREWHEYLLPEQRPWHSIGDRLWVREAWRTLHKWDCLAPRQLADDISKITYEADPERRNPLWCFGKLRPGMFMPRWASRLTLYVTDVRVERLQDISKEDARAEGAGLYVPGHGFITEDELRADPGYSNFLAPRLGFEAIWTEINGPGSWAGNPWVAAYTFIPRLGNIDTLPATLEEAA